jgi:antitoxin component YwqK of YwqJK toxin-antitoxin module
MSLTFDKIRISTLNDRNSTVLTKNYDTLPVKSVDKRTGKTITAKNEKFTFVGTFTKAKDVDLINDSKTFLFTGTGQLSHHKNKLLLLYDGDWKRGEKHGKGVENYYNRNSSLDRKYIGNFKNGYRSGEGKVYKLQNNELFYEGTFKNGIIVKGKKYRNGHIVYEGSFSKNKANGNGKLYAENRFCIYDGKFKDGKKNGKGKLYSESTGKKLYEGNFKKDEKNGKGIEYDENGKKLYVGPFRNNERHGKGTLYYPSGKEKYVGMFYKGREEGKGKRFFENGKLEHIGQFYRGNLHKGIQYYLSGSYMKGYFMDNLPNGYTYEYDRNGKLLSECVMTKGIYDGRCKFYHTNGKIQFKGWYRDGEKHGEGVEYNSEGTVIRKGKWLKGVYIGGAKQKRQTVKRTKKEANIRYFLQTKDSNYLKKLTVKDLKEFLSQKANKVSQSKTKKKLAKQLQQWHASIPRLRQAAENTVYDAYMVEHVPFDEFLEEENRIILVTKENVNFGVYLEQREILYECAPRSQNKSFSSYVGDPSAKGIVRLPTSTGGNFNFWRTGKLLKEIANGKNVFHIEQEPENIRVLSKDVAMGGTHVSGLHCDPKDIIKISKIKKSEKIGEGCRCSIAFEF